MKEITAALAAQQGELRSLLTPLSPAQWDAASRCPGWSVADVVLHLAQTNEIALGSATGAMTEALAASGWGAIGANVDEIAGRAVVDQRGADPAELFARWDFTARALCAAFAASDPRQPMAWVIGELPARTLATTRLAEAWIHTGDVAAAIGIEPAVENRIWHIARLAWRTLPYAFTRAGRELAGPVALELVAPDGSPWSFGDTDSPATTVRGPAQSFCLVAGRRLAGKDSDLRAEGPDADAVLDLVRTFA